MIAARQQRAQAQAELPIAGDSVEVAECFSCGHLHFEPGCCPECGAGRQYQRRNGADAADPLLKHSRLARAYAGEAARCDSKAQHFRDLAARHGAIGSAGLPGQH